VFTADYTKPQMAVIDTATRKVAQWIALPGLGYGAAPTKDGKWLLVAVPTESKVAVIDLASMKVVRTVDVPAVPQEVVIRPDQKVAYVSCVSSGKVGAIDLGSWKCGWVGVGEVANGRAEGPGEGRSG
jgi:DNA-binding beta-propeller fold protein YncE